MQSADILLTHDYFIAEDAGIGTGMFIMLGCEGEDVSDIEATVEHLKKSLPNIFLTTVSYPIKGTTYCKTVADKVTNHLAWEQRPDRDIEVEGLFSAEFSSHTTRYMINAVSLHKARLAGSRNVAQPGKLYVNAQRGRIGMRRTQHQRSQAANSTGWQAKERTTDAW